MTEVLFKFRPLLGLNEDQEKFHDRMRGMKGFYYCDTRTWACDECDRRIEDIAKDIAIEFPEIVFEGFAEYRINGGRVGLPYRFIFNSDDIRLYYVYTASEDDFKVKTGENYLPDPPDDVKGPDPTWIVRQWTEERGEEHLWVCRGIR